MIEFQHIAQNNTTFGSIAQDTADKRGKPEPRNVCSTKYRHWLRVQRRISIVGLSSPALYDTGFGVTLVIVPVMSTSIIFEQR